MDWLTSMLHARIHPLLSLLALPVRLQHFAGCSHRMDAESWLICAMKRTLSAAIMRLKSSASERHSMADFSTYAQIVAEVPLYARDGLAESRGRKIPPRLARDILGHRGNLRTAF